MRWPRPAQRAREALSVAAVGALLAAGLAAPVLRAPTERVVGRELVGRHHDAFSVMVRFDRPLAWSLHTQPVTDLPGALVARVVGGVAAYNALVLLSFPLSALFACVLARHLALSRPASAFAALAYAFSPFHLAHAAYHPHIAQTQWVPLYLLALWRLLDRASPGSVALLAAATAAAALSNFYGGLVLAVVTPVAVLAYWLAIARTQPSAPRRLLITSGLLLVMAAAGLAYAWVAVGVDLAGLEAWAVPRADLFRYSAYWWSYLVPPAGHPVLGTRVQRLWAEAGVDVGLLEQQVSLGWGIVVLGLAAVIARVRPANDVAGVACVPVLAAVAAVALLCSLAPEFTVAGVTVAGPSGWLFALLPMFRSYARFAVVVQLMAVLLAGVGVDVLWRRRVRWARVLAVALVALVAAEYVVSPRTWGRDVLPTTAHRWVVRQAAAARAYDCAPWMPASGSLAWLTRGRVAQEGIGTDCTEPHLASRLAATGYTHLIVRAGTDDGRRFLTRGEHWGLRLVAREPDAGVFEIDTRLPPLVTVGMTGLFPREHTAEWSWRWMGDTASWAIVNTTTEPLTAMLEVEMSSFQHTRAIEVSLDQVHVQTLHVPQERQVHVVGPLTVPPGRHAVGFRALDAPTVVGPVLRNGDSRALSTAFGMWAWRKAGDRPGR